MDIELKLTTETVDRAGLVTPLSVELHTPIREVFGLLKRRGTGSILVCQEGRLIGIFTERDALRFMQRRGEMDAPIESIMVREPVTLRREATVASAILRMSSGGYRRLPIVDGEQRPVGILEVSGIIHYLVQHFPKTVYNLPPVAHPVMQDREGP